ncbi:MAG: MBOAT family protein [Oscillospiraceae bacterium]|nr:MBOAT family protein [Oscillospiraceae bacterium]
MLFSSSVFLFIFLPAVLLGHFLLRGQRARNLLLLAASLFFYAWGEPVYVLLMLFSICANYLLGRGIDAKRGRGIDAKRGRGRKALLVLAVVVDLGILFVFKYLNFTIENLNALLGLRIAPVKLSLPIGISFFTFQALSYCIDVYRGTAEVQRNLLDLGLYISFFPQLIAGPIVRYNTVAQQIRSRSVDAEGFQQGVKRFILGFAKKILLANNLSIAAEEAFSLAGTGELTTALAWLGSLSYSLQIYFDFSGYSDMAIGLGRMFGFRFEENFNYPYISRSVSEFWKRWHISLGRWFRDYIYFPLGGSRVSKAKLLRNLFAVWLFTGIWHGAAWQFIVWGLMYGLLVAFEKLSGVPGRLRTRAGRGLYAALTMLIVNAGWVLFGAESFAGALTQLGAMLGIHAAAPSALAGFLLRESWVFLAAGVLFSTPVVSRALAKLRAGREDKPLLILGETALYMLLLVLCVSYLAMGSHNPFIYFNF